MTSTTTTNVYPGIHSHIEEKFDLVKTGEGIYQGKHKLEKVGDAARGVFGGDLVAQGIAAAWETVDGDDFSPHSLHSYFIKGGQPDSVMRWEIKATGLGRNYMNRLAQCYQSHNDVLVFAMMISFTRNNDIKNRKLAYSQKPGPKVPFEFQPSPHDWFTKYKDDLDKLLYFEHTNNNLQHIVPEEFFNGWTDEFLSQPIGNRQFGVFVRVNDDLTKAKNLLKTRFLQLAFASDSLYLATLPSAIGPPLETRHFFVFNVSLDHTLWFHDLDFDPTRWMFIDYRFSRMSNDRVLVQCHVYNEHNVCVASISQEAVLPLPKEYIDKAIGGSYKL